MRFSLVAFKLVEFSPSYGHSMPKVMKEETLSIKCCLTHYRKYAEMVSTRSLAIFGGSSELPMWLTGCFWVTFFGRWWGAVRIHISQVQLLYTYRYLFMCGGGDIHMWELPSHVGGLLTCGGGIHVWEFLTCGGAFMCGSFSCVERTFMCGTFLHVEGHSHVGVSHMWRGIHMWELINMQGSKHIWRTHSHTTAIHSD